MRWLIGASLLAVIGLLMWAWWLPTLLTFVALSALYVCFDWQHVSALWLGELFVSPRDWPNVQEWRRKAADWDTYVQMDMHYQQTVAAKEEMLRQLRRGTR